MKAAIWVSLCAVPCLVFGQTMSIEEYQPKSTLVVPEHILTRAKYPFVDVHSHQNAQMPPERLDQLIRDMDSLNMGIMVNLSGGFGERLKRGIANMKGRYTNRFVLFANLDFSGIDDPDYGKRAAAQLEASKVFAKNLMGDVLSYPELAESRSASRPGGPPQSEKLPCASHKNCTRHPSPSMIAARPPSAVRLQIASNSSSSSCFWCRSA